MKDDSEVIGPIFCEIFEILEETFENVFALDNELELDDELELAEENGDEPVLKSNALKLDILKSI